MNISWKFLECLWIALKIFNRVLDLSWTDFNPKLQIWYILIEHPHLLIHSILELKKIVVLKNEKPKINHVPINFQCPKWFYLLNLKSSLLRSKNRKFSNYSRTNSEEIMSKNSKQNCKTERKSRVLVKFVLQIISNGR